MIDPHIAMLAVATLASGWLMAHAGLQKGALERRRQRRSCPSCGRHLRRAGLRALPRRLTYFLACGFGLRLSVCETLAAALRNSWSASSSSARPSSSTIVSR